MSDIQPAPAEAPVTPQSNDEAIRGFAEGFLKNLEDNQDTEQLDEHQAAEEPPPQEETPPEEAEPEAETPPEPEIPLVEVDIDGEKFSIPEKVKHRVMADKDYRQKTMEIAAERKQLQALTATAAQVAQQAQQLAPQFAQLHLMESRAQQLQQALQSPQLAQDPVSFNNVQGELAILLHQKDQFARGLEQYAKSLNQEQQRIRAEKMALEAPKLLEEIPDFAKPEAVTQLRKYVEDQGLPPEAIDYLQFSVPGARLAWKAQQFDRMVKDQATAQAKLKEKVKTLPSANQSSRAGNTKSANEQQLLKDWQKGGGKIHDPAFSKLLRSKLGR